VKEGVRQDAGLTREGGSIPVIASFDRILEGPGGDDGIGLHRRQPPRPNEKIDLDQFHKGNLAAPTFSRSWRRRRDGGREGKSSR